MSSVNLTQMGRFARGLDIHLQERRGERRDGDIPFQAALERHLLSGGRGAGESQDGQDGQREAGCGDCNGSCFLSCGLRYNGETSFPARRPSAGAVPGRWGACLAVRTPPAALLQSRTNQPIRRP